MRMRGQYCNGAPYGTWEWASWDSWGANHRNCNDDIPCNCKPGKKWKAWDNSNCGATGGFKRRFKNYKQAKCETAWHRRRRVCGSDCDPVEYEPSIAGCFAQPIDCEYREWEGWEGCPGVNGVCIDSMVHPDPPRQTRRSWAQRAANEGHECTQGDPRIESAMCGADQFIYCPVHCEWSSWNEWCECSEGCGEGIRLRNRTVTQEPVYSGDACKDEDQFENETCMVMECMQGSVKRTCSPEAMVISLLIAALLRVCT